MRGRPRASVYSVYSVYSVVEGDEGEAPGQALLHELHGGGRPGPDHLHLLLGGVRGWGGPLGDESWEVGAEEAGHILEGPGPGLEVTLDDDHVLHSLLYWGNAGMVIGVNFRVISSGDIWNQIKCHWTEKRDMMAG